MLRSTLVTSRAVSSLQHTTTASLLSPFFTRFQQCRQASVLSSISDTAGAYNKRIRRGRGPGSGKGKTSGRGHKGQKQHGKVPAGFNGGQTPEEVVHGIKGFENKYVITTVLRPSQTGAAAGGGALTSWYRNPADLAEVNISKLAKWISAGRINPGRPITVIDLVRSNCISSPRSGVKLLAREDPNGPSISVPIQIIVSRASAGAVEAIERAGGQVVTRYYSKSSVQRVMKGLVHPYYSLQSRPLLPVLQRPGQHKTTVSGVTATGSDAVSPSDSTKPDTPTTAATDAILTASDAASAHASGNVQLDANGLSVEVLLEMRRYPYRLADPAGRKEIEYYRDAARRGYLSHTVEEGRAASLFFMPPARGEEEVARRSTPGKGKAQVENRLW